MIGNLRANGGMALDEFRFIVKVQSGCANLDLSEEVKSLVFVSSPVYNGYIIDLVRIRFVSSQVQSENYVPAQLRIVDYSVDRDIRWWCNGKDIDAESRRRFFFGSPLRPDRDHAAGLQLWSRWINVDRRDDILIRKLALRYGLVRFAVGA